MKIQKIFETVFLSVNWTNWNTKVLNKYKPWGRKGSCKQLENTLPGNIRFLVKDSFQLSLISIYIKWYVCLNVCVRTLFVCVMGTNSPHPTELYPYMNLQNVDLCHGPCVIHKLFIDDFTWLKSYICEVKEGDGGRLPVKGYREGLQWKRTQVCFIQ